VAAAGARVIIPADLDYTRLLAALGSVGPGLILLRCGNYSEAESLECIRRVLRRIPLDELPKFIVVGRPGKNPATVASSLIWVPGAAWSPYPKGPALAGYARPGVLVAGKKDVKAFAFDECEQRAVFDAPHCLLPGSGPRRHQGHSRLSRRAPTAFQTCDEHAAINRLNRTGLMVDSWPFAA